MNPGTILSDRRIRELCEPPVGEFQYTDSRVRGVAVQRHVQLYKEHLAPNFDLAKYVLEYATKHGGPQPHMPRIDMFDAESAMYKQHHANFQPMIEPYSPRQVRQAERDATQDEHDLIMAMSDKGISNKEMILVELRKKAPGIQSIRLDPLLGFQILEKIVSHGLSSYGYDVTCGNKFKIFTNVNSAIVDPKNFDERSFVDVETTHEKPYVIIPPNSFALAVTREYLRIPRNVITVCVGKSTYARCGIIVNVTPFEPEWEGYVTLEFSNTTPLPAKVYADEGCAQVLFFQADEDCEVSYKDRHGKYQGQAGVPVVPKV